MIGLPGLDESWVHEDIFIHQRDEAVMNHSRRLQEEARKGLG